MHTLLQDLRYGFRQLLKNPGFTTVAVLSLALGIGANTALFSLVDAVLLRKLPVRKPDELVLFKSAMGQSGIARGHNGTIMPEPGTGIYVSSSFSYPAFEEMRAHTRTLSDLFAFAPRGNLNVNIDGQAEIASGQLVTGGFYTGLDVQPVLGRAITADDDRTAADPVAVMSYRYWQRRFGLNAAVVGKTVNVNGVPVTIVGVTPPQFYAGLQLSASPDLSLPMTLAPRLDPSGKTRSQMAQAWYWWVRVMGRMKRGVSLEQVRAELEGVFQQSALAGSQAMPNRRAPDAGPRELPRLRVLPGSQGEVYLRQSYEQPLRIMLIVVGLVLLIACANIANLLLGRAVARRQEIAVRLALGARRVRLIRQLLTENLLLAAGGGALGCVLAWWTKDLLLVWQPRGGSPLNAELHMDWRVFGFTAAVALLTGLLFGLAPALRATRIDLHSALKENTRGWRSSLSVLGKSLVVAQVAASLLLLAGAGLFARTLHNLQKVEWGFNLESLLYFRLDPHAKGYKTEQMPALYETVSERIGALPGVRAVTISEFAALSGSGSNGSAYAQARAPLPPPLNNVFQQLVRWNYLETMEIPLLAGRGLSPRDDERAPKVAVINQVMASRFFGDENPVGRRFGFGAENSGQFEIVGVARNSRYLNPRRDVPAMVYLPYPQHSLRQVTFAVRTAGEPNQMLAAIRAVVRDVDKDLPLFDSKTQMEQLAQSLAQERFFPKLTGVFGFLALLLASIGLYGVMSYAVARRTNEIGLRMALGAQRRNVIKMVLWESMMLVVLGVLIGLGAVLATTRFVSTMLYGLTPTDPATISLAVLVLVTVASLAGYLPARKAAQVDPLVALRYE
jgi:predicted permease